MIGLPFKPGYIHRVSRGLVPGAFTWNQFGKTTIDNDAVFHDVWEYGSASLGDTNYTFSNDGSAIIDSISSDDNGDTQPVNIIGLDANLNWTVQDINLTGQTTASLTTPLCRVFSLTNEDSSTTPSVGTGFAGDVYCYSSVAVAINGITNGKPDVDTDVKAYANNGKNNFLNALFTCPANYTAYVLWSRVSLVTKVANFAELRIYVRDYGKYSRLVDEGSITTNGTSVSTQKFEIPIPLTAGTDFIPRMNVNVNDTNVTVSTSFLLIRDGFNHYG